VSRPQEESMSGALIGFDDDDEHVLCERCSKDRLCCEKFQRDCGACGGEGGWPDDEVADEDGFPLWDECECCNGQGWFWFCDCDENGQHAAKVSPFPGGNR
jgi:hypothetical protein